MTAPIAQAGMPKKKRAYGYSATNTRNTASSMASSDQAVTSSTIAAKAGTIVSSRSITPNRLRPRRPSISRPKYQKIASVTTGHRPGSLASGQVKIRHSSPPRTLDGYSTRLFHRLRSMAQRNMLATQARTTRTVVVTSSVPMRNHGSLALRRSGTENENRPAMGPNRILDI